MTIRLDQLRIVASARTEGAITNRVVMQRPPKRAKIERVKAARTGRFKIQHERGRPYKVICISVFTDDLKTIDRGAARAHLSRSAFIRVACLAYETST